MHGPTQLNFTDYFKETLKCSIILTTIFDYVSLKTDKSLYYHHNCTISPDNKLYFFNIIKYPFEFKFHKADTKGEMGKK